MLDKIKSFVKKHQTPLISAAVLVGLLLLLNWAVGQRTARLTVQHIESVTAAQTAEKEVKTNAETVRQTQTSNDSRVQQAVENAGNTVPDSLDALIDMANAIIRDSNASRR